ncbi:MAG: hypothetical protein WDZ51_16390 [Pirellulaceae bacterium]
MTRSTQQPQSFPAVELLPGLTAQFDPHAIETDEDGVIRPKTEGHIHSFDLDLYGDDRSDAAWIRFHVNDQDGDPIKLACQRLAEIKREICKLTKELKQLDSDAYPYPPAGSESKPAKVKRIKSPGKRKWQVVVITGEKGKVVHTGLSRGTAANYCLGFNQGAKEEGVDCRAIAVKEPKSHE